MTESKNSAESLESSLDKNEFFKNIYKKIKSVLSDDITILSITHYQYQEAYEFKKDHCSVRINIFYNSSGKITSIQPKENDSLSKSILDRLSRIDREDISSKYDEIDESVFQGNDFLQEFYTDIKEEFEKSDIFITKIENIQYGQRYTFVRNNEYAKFIIWYNSKGTITKVNAVKQYPKNATIAKDINAVFSRLSNS